MAALVLAVLTLALRVEIANPLCFFRQTLKSDVIRR